LPGGDVEEEIRGRLGGSPGGFSSKGKRSASGSGSIWA
jgi:hypothetical protein